MSSRKGISTRRNSVCIKTMDTNTKCMHVEFGSSRLFGHLKEGTTREIDTYTAIPILAHGLQTTLKIPNQC